MKTEAIRKTRVAVYCRVSTDMEEQEGSFTLQKEYYQRLIEENPQMVLAGRTTMDELVKATYTV